MFDDVLDAGVKGSDEDVRLVELCFMHALG
jgi:hypothetical protein